MYIHQLDPADDRKMGATLAVKKFLHLGSCKYHYNQKKTNGIKQGQISTTKALRSSVEALQY